MVIVIWHMTDKAMMERKTRHEVQELLVAEYETDGSKEFITAKIRTLVSWQNQRNGTSFEKLEFDEALQEAFLCSVARGDFDELEVEGFLTRKIYRNASGQTKTRSSSTPVRCIKRKFLRICKTMAAIWKHSLFQVLVNQDCKDLARRINIINRRYINSLILFTGQRWKDIWFHTRRGVKMWQSYDIDATFGF